ncbi:MAG: hypothetical protein R2713_06350 [Ilumatobacteraceae bacterium]
MLGALVAMAVGFGAVLWLTRSGDDDTRDTASTDAGGDTPDDTGALDTGAPDAPPVTVPVTTPAATVEPVPVTTIPLTLPGTVALTDPPPPTTEAPIPVAVPADAVPYADPAGWSLAVAPGWRFEQTPTFTGWFTGTGSDGFQDNVNVVLEDLPRAMDLATYVDAAVALIQGQAPDAVITDRQRVVGPDGVEVELVSWTGTLPGLPTLAFVQAMTITDTRAYVATFTSEPARIADLALAFGQYLATVRAA